MATTRSSICTPTEARNVVPFARTRANTPSPSENNGVIQQTVYNNYYYTRAREDTKMVVQEISEMYLDTLARPMPRYVCQEVEQLMEAGIHPDMICAVLAYTAGAPRPSWGYARAVLEKQAAMGARTAADFHGNVSKWRQSRSTPREQPKRTIQQQYNQRTYDPAEFDGIPDDLMEELRRSSHE